MPLQPAPSARMALKTVTRNHFHSRFIDGALEAAGGMTTSFCGEFIFTLHSTALVTIGCAAILFSGALLHAETNSFAAQAERAYNEAQQRSRQEPTNSAAVLQLARAAFDWGELAPNDDTRENVAERGIGAARSLLSREPTNAAAHYWLGMNLGQLARTKTLGALRLVREMEDEFHRARSLDENVDYAGPDRSLGYLYRDVPGWPTSIGSKKKAREHFERAVQLHPEFPDNQLGLLESFEKWADKKNFERQLPITEKAVSDARAKFTGASWESSWADWTRRLAEMKRKSAGVGKATANKGAK
jgi:tetratricopeptide (TPR) repeat protein